MRHVNHNLSCQNRQICSKARIPWPKSNHCVCSYVTVEARSDFFCSFLHWSTCSQAGDAFSIYKTTITLNIVNLIDGKRSSHPCDQFFFHQRIRVISDASWVGKSPWGKPFQVFKHTFRPEYCFWWCLQIYWMFICSRTSEIVMIVFIHQTQAKENNCQCQNLN